MFANFSIIRARPGDLPPGCAARRGIVYEVDTARVWVAEDRTLPPRSVRVGPDCRTGWSRSLGAYPPGLEGVVPTALFSLTSLAIKRLSGGRQHDRVIAFALASAFSCGCAFCSCFRGVGKS